MNILGRELTAKQILDNPTRNNLRKMAISDEETTSFGSASYITKIRSRSAKFTRIVGEDISRDDALGIVDEVLAYLKDRTLIQMDRSLCQNEEFQLSCRLYVTDKFARIPLMWSETLFPHHKDEVDLVTITIPEWKERKVIAFPEDGVSIVLGTDYMGENKKSMLRHLMYRAKKIGWLGLHAGSKLLRVKNNNKVKDVGFLFFGLSGTGKTSLSCHSHWLKNEESVVIRQDDVVLLREDGSALGTEDSFYIKTDGLSAEDQAVIYAAAISPRALMENVYTDKESGHPDFFNCDLTSNGRAVVKRSDMAFSDDDVDLPKADCIVFITRRNDVVPPLAKLNPEQAAAAFMLGESIETSAGDPSQAGKSKRVVGTNPFIVGPLFEEGNRFLDILRKNPDIQCFVMNTGKVGMSTDSTFKGDKVTLKMSAKLIELIARDTIKWRLDERWGFEVPVDLPEFDMKIFDPASYYDTETYNALCNKLTLERKEWMASFDGLYPEISATIT